MGSPKIPALAFILLSSPLGSPIAYLTSIIWHELFCSPGLREYVYITEVSPKCDSHHSASNEFEAMDPSHKSQVEGQAESLTTPYANTR